MLQYLVIILVFHIVHLSGWLLIWISLHLIYVNVMLQIIISGTQLMRYVVVIFIHLLFYVSIL